MLRCIKSFYDAGLIGFVSENWRAGFGFLERDKIAASWIKVVGNFVSAAALNASQRATPIEALPVCKNPFCLKRLQ
jgi:hypothetical protein